MAKKFPVSWNFEANAVNKKTLLIFIDILIVIKNAKQLELRLQPILLEQLYKQLNQKIMSAVKWLFTKDS